MTISSMTGFARVDGALDARRWIWEARSVNGRGLEFRFRGPPGFDHLDPELRKRAGEAFTRGSVSATLTLDQAATGRALRINEEALEQAIRIVRSISSRIECEKPRPEGIAALRGVLEPDEGAEDEETRAALASALTQSFVRCLSELQKSRRNEGEKLLAALSAQIFEIDRLTAAARGHAGAGLESIKARIRLQLAELLDAGAIPAERLEQEAALLAIKADIREELDRLAAHIAAARELLAAPDPVGRKLDFLSQEFNREANTLCAKAQDITLKRIGLELKTAIDQFREQAQNVE
jgi:uncharacterized protein (TIGR00255 family)